MKNVKTIFRLNDIIMTKVELQLVNDVALSTRSSSELRGNAIRLSDFYVCDDVHQ